MDLSALFLPRQPAMTSREATEEAERCNGLLKYMQCCIIEGRKFNILPKEEKGLPCRPLWAAINHLLCKYHSYSVCGGEGHGADIKISPTFFNSNECLVVSISSFVTYGGGIGSA